MTPGSSHIDPHEIVKDVSIKAEDTVPRSISPFPSHLPSGPHKELTYSLEATPLHHFLQALIRKITLSIQNLSRLINIINAKTEVSLSADLLITS